MLRRFRFAKYGAWCAAALVLTAMGYGVQHAVYAANPANWGTEQCCGKLTSKSADERAAAAKRLGELKSMDGVPALTGAMQDPDVATRRLAARALGEIGSPKPLKSFFDVAFWDKDPSVRAEAARAVGKIRDTTPIVPLRWQPAGAGRTKNTVAPASVKYYQSTRPLAYLLRDSDPTVRREAALALGEIKDGWAVDDLTASVGDAVPAVRQACCMALGKIGDARAASALEAASKEFDPVTKAAATEALTAIGAGAVADVR
jgi:HEAT repeat protein